MRVDDELETERSHLQRSQLLFCDECGCDSDAEARGWEGHLAQEEDDTVTVAFFCPRCAAEFL
jgi:hypothetical protein